MEGVCKWAEEKEVRRTEEEGVIGKFWLDAFLFFYAQFWCCLYRGCGAVRQGDYEPGGVKEGNHVSYYAITCGEEEEDGTVYIHVPYQYSCTLSIVLLSLPALFTTPYSPTGRETLYTALVSRSQ